MLVKVNGKIENLDKIRTITIDDVYLKDVYESDVSDFARAIFGIAIAIQTEQELKKYVLNYLGDEDESQLPNMETTKEKVKEYALHRLTEMFGGRCIDYI